jgi:hypothetical protein
MKWLFILLLIINLALFGWMITRKEAPGRPESVIAPGDTTGLRLLSEVRKEKEEEARREEEARKAEEDLRAEEARRAEETREAEEAAALAAREAEEEAREAAEAMTQQPEPEPMDVEEEPTLETAEVESDLVAESEPESEPEFIYVQKPVDSPLAGAVGITEQCGILGPIGDRQRARSAEEILKNAEIEVWVKEQSERTRIGFWVVIPSLESTEQVQEKIQELADAGIKDIWVFRSGELKNSISLGMFSQEENAQNYSQVAAAKGFKTVLRPRFLNKKRYRLSFRIENSEPAIKSMWQQIELQFPHYELNMTPCEQIATP